MAVGPAEQRGLATQSEPCRPSARPGCRPPQAALPPPSAARHSQLGDRAHGTLVALGGTEGPLCPPPPRGWPPRGREAHLSVLPVPAKAPQAVTVRISLAVGQQAGDG